MARRVKARAAVQIHAKIGFMGLMSVVLACGSPAPAERECAESIRELNAAVKGPGLTTTQRSCLQLRLQATDDPERSAVSELLIWDARGDTADWQRRVEYHVEHVEPDRLDYLVDLARQAQHDGPAGAKRSMVWVEAGLVAVGRTAEGARRSSVEHDLLKLRAIASEMMSPPEASVSSRRQTAKHARAWYLMAKELGKDTEWPLAMCANASAPEDYCRGRADRH
jgi:hypothetical protein